MKRIKTILLLLLPMAIFGIGASPRSAECLINSTRAMIASLKTACDMFEVDTGLYPTEQQGLAALLVDPGVTNWQGPYIKSRDNAPPKDAWGKDFRYRVVEGQPAIDSSGPDGLFGTDDDNGKNWKPKARTTGCSRTR